MSSNTPSDSTQPIHNSTTSQPRLKMMSNLGSNRVANAKPYRKVSATSRPSKAYCNDILLSSFDLPDIASNVEIQTTSTPPSALPSSSSSHSQITTASGQPVESTEKRKRIFSKELRCMMYGFGDDLNPYTETVDMVEDLVLQFIGDIAIRALNFGANDRITTDDLLYILRKDPKKYSRLKELLDMNHELRQARKAFDEIKYIEP